MYFSSPVNTVSFPVGSATSANQATMIAQLTALEGYVDGLEALITALTGYVDGIETLLADQATAANQTTIVGHVDGIEGLLTTLNGYVDGIETLLGNQATAVNQTTIIGHVDGIEGLLTTLNGYVDGIETLLTNIDTKTTYLTVVDMLDTPLLDAAVTPIAGNAGAFLTVVASLAAPVKALRVADTTGAFIGVYNNANTLLTVINAGIDGEIPLTIATGETIKLRSMDASAISLGNLVINFLG